MTKNTDSLPYDQKPRRKLKNLIVNSRALLRASIPFLFLIISNVCIVIFANIRMVALEQEMLLQSPERALDVMQLSVRVFLPAFGAMTLTSMMSIGIWILFSHRIFGPIVSIRRRIHGLARGDFDSRIQLRTHDEFKEIADDLNALAEALQKSKTML